MTLSVISAVAGLLIALASLALLWQQKIYIDAETKQITKIDLPFGIKLQTNAPVIAIVFMGVALVAIPVLKQKQQNMVALRGHISASDELKVYAIADEKVTQGDFILEVPGDARYTVMFLPKDGVPAIDNQLVDLVAKHGDPFLLKDEQVQQILAGGATALPNGPIQRESPDVVSQFK